MSADRLQKAWAALRVSREIDPVMRFTDEGLVFGAGTVLAKSGGVLLGRGEARLGALLAAAHCFRPTHSALAHLRKAVERWHEGEQSLATMHLALSRLERLARPESDARRMFLAEHYLDAGVGAEAIIEAVACGDGEFRKYDPDQARVPAGSGRTSGEWTSGGTDPAAGSNASRAPPDSSNWGEVNPETLTQVVRPQGYATPYACQVAQVHCVDAAVEASQGDSTDVPRNLDLKNCRDAGTACKLMSVVQQLLPLPLGGGVRFPHGGVVLIVKGRTDVYVPPDMPGYRSSFRRGSVDQETRIRAIEHRSMNEYVHPDWNPTPDEVASQSPAEFRDMQRVANSFCTVSSGRILSQTYRLSKQWGKILRSRIAFESDGKSAEALLTCWNDPDSGMRFDLGFDCCAKCGG